ncbi:MAG: flagellar hook-basal body complex protein [Deltaproteobacteria bacterium]|nr:flagellar hook-basal body complex protein [Deltaproteobacteria bacterium]TLN04829.1 MAG: flagellar hook-basal body complex protein [bacterium]
MSITSALFTGVSGLVNNGEAMNVIGNNIANVNTVGFKSARTLFSDMLSANMGNNSQIGRGVQIQKIDNVFGQSSFETTESSSDVAIQGSSFFALEGGLYSRAGAFRLNAAGDLVNPDGYKILDSSGAAINLGAGSTITKIDSTGTITYVNSSNATLSDKQLGVAIISDTGSLDKVGGTLFKYSGATAPTVIAANGTSEKIYSNALELSNVDLASQFVKMIVTQRAYSANSKTITTTDEMTQEVLNLKR